MNAAEPQSSEEPVRARPSEAVLANVAPDGSSFRGRAARSLLILSAVFAAYFGMSSLLLPFVGAPNLYTGLARWTAPTAGALQLIAAAAALVLALRRDLRGATLVSAVYLLLGWLDTLPPAIRHGLDFHADAALTSACFVAFPVIVLSALAWRNSRPILAAFIVTAPATIGLLISIAFAISIAIYGF